MIALCLGWDVGGWQGQKDGLAAVALSRQGNLSWVGETRTVGLGSTIADGELTLGHLAEPIGLAETLHDAGRIVVGIDAPFAFPAPFADSANLPLDTVQSPGDRLPERYIDNALAYRHTDRFVHERTGKRPLSPSFAALANNVTKTRCGLAQLIRHDDVGVPPLLADEGRAAAVEVYPALWKERFDPDAMLPRLGLGDQSERFERLADSHEDEHDAVVAALSAAAYEGTWRDMETPLPRVAMPPDRDQVRREGWIFMPLLKQGGSR